MLEEQILTTCQRKTEHQGKKKINKKQKKKQPKNKSTKM